MDKDTKLGQDSIRDVFRIGQTVLVRSGRDWHSREIQDITVYRAHPLCPQCNMTILGEPRFWFKDFGNVQIEDIMALEDIDPKPDAPVGRLAVPAHIIQPLTAEEALKVINFNGLPYNKASGCPMCGGILFDRPIGFENIFRECKACVMGFYQKETGSL